MALAEVLRRGKGRLRMKWKLALSVRKYVIYAEQFETKIYNYT